MLPAILEKSANGKQKHRIKQVLKNILAFLCRLSSDRGPEKKI